MNLSQWVYNNFDDITNPGVFPSHYPRVNIQI